MEFETFRDILRRVLTSAPFNVFDLLIIASYLFYVYEEYSYGFYSSLVHLFAIIASFFLGIGFYSLISSPLQSWFSFSKGAADALGFFIVASVSYAIVTNILTVAKRKAKLNPIDPTANKIGALIFGSVSFFLLASFIVTILLSMPISEYVKSQIRDSLSGKLFYSNTEYLEGSVKRVFGGAINDTINFLTVKPQSDQSINLHFKTTSLSIDESSEKEMLRLVNREREKRGVPSLVADTRLREAARLHAKDMFTRGYFSHYTPEGFSPFDRLSNLNIEYGTAAENLAFAPDVTLAVNGLMKSQGHRENILNPVFTKIGIGVIDGKIYGKMFVQEFTD